MDQSNRRLMIVPELISPMVDSPVLTGRRSNEAENQRRSDAANEPPSKRARSPPRQQLAVGNASSSVNNQQVNQQSSAGASIPPDAGQDNRKCDNDHAVLIDGNDDSDADDCSAAESDDAQTDTSDQEEPQAAAAAAVAAPAATNRRKKQTRRLPKPVGPVRRAKVHPSRPGPVPLPEECPANDVLIYTNHGNAKLSAGAAQRDAAGAGDPPILWQSAVDYDPTVEHMEDHIHEYFDRQQYRPSLRSAAAIDNSIAVPDLDVEQFVRVRRSERLLAGDDEHKKVLRSIYQKHGVDLEVQPLPRYRPMYPMAELRGLPGVVRRGGGARIASSRESTVAPWQRWVNGFPPNVAHEGQLEYRSDVASTAVKFSAKRPLRDPTTLTPGQRFVALYDEERVPFDSELARLVGQHTHMDHVRRYWGPNKFNLLSDELLLNIFHYLPKKCLQRVGLVCQRFQRVAQDESLWQRVDLGGRTLLPGALGRAIRLGIRVLRLSQSTIAEPVFADADLRLDAIKRVRLQYLDLSMCAIGPKALLELLICCRDLRKLSLEHVPVNDHICEQIAANGKLEVLNMTMAQGLTAYGVRMIASSLHGLEAFNVSWSDLDHNAVGAIAECLPPRLQSLNMAGCRRSLGDAQLAQIVRRCPELRELDASDASQLTAEAVPIICAGLRRLESLALSRCYNIPVTAYLAINEQITTLQHLDIFGVLSEQTMQMLKTSFPKVNINKFLHSVIARPTTGSRRTSVWGQRTRD